MLVLMVEAIRALPCLDLLYALLVVTVFCAVTGGPPPDANALEKAQALWMFEGDDPQLWQLKDNHQHEHPTKAVLKNRRLVFIGDSLTRYQYVNLIHFLHRNSWVQSDFPSIENERQWTSWKSFHLGSASRFGCQEICDCYRDTTIGSYKENRHYHDITANISISMFLWFPPRPIFYAPVPNPSAFSELCADVNKMIAYATNYEPGSSLVRENILSFLRDVVAPMVPDAIIINQGLWSYPELRHNEEFRAEFTSLLKNISNTVVWKKTTSRCIGFDEIDDEGFTSDLQSKGLEVFDTYMLTLGVASQHVDNDPHKSICWDGDSHFNPFVYRELNKQLLKYLGNLLGE
jgi:hypothetical protein